MMEKKDKLEWWKFLSPEFLSRVTSRLLWSRVTRECRDAWPELSTRDIEKRAAVMLALTVLSSQCGGEENAVEYVGKHAKYPETLALIREVHEKLNEEIGKLAQHTYRIGKYRATALSKIGRQKSPLPLHAFTECVIAALDVRPWDHFLSIGEEAQDMNATAHQLAGVEMTACLPVKTEILPLLDLQVILSEGDINMLPVGAGAADFAEAVITKAWLAPENLPEGKPTENWELLQDWMDRMPKDARLAALLPVDALDGKAPVQALHALIQGRQLSAVISLPVETEDLLRGRCLVVLEHGSEKIRLVAADREREIARSGLVAGVGKSVAKMLARGGDCVKDIPVQEFQEGMSLLPDDYVAGPPQKYPAVSLGDLLREMTRGANSMKLRQLVTPDHETDVRVITIGTIDSEELGSLSYVPQGEEKYLVQPGDIVMTRLSSYRFRYIQDMGDLQILADSNVYILRPDKDQVEPAYLYLYMKGRDGLAQLNRLSGGTKLGAISLRQLGQVQIPLPPMEEQKKIAEAFQQEMEKMEQAQAVVRGCREEIDGLLDKML